MLERIKRRSSKPKPKPPPERPARARAGEPDPPLPRALALLRLWDVNRRLGDIAMAAKALAELEELATRRQK